MNDSMEFIKHGNDNLIRNSKEYLPFVDMLVHACDREHVAWFGTFTRQTDQSVMFSMPGVSFAVRVSGATTLDMTVTGGCNRALITTRKCSDGSTLETEIELPDSCECIALSGSLDPATAYDIIVTKVTEAEIRTAFTSFKPVTVRWLSIDSGKFHVIEPKSIFFPRGWIEVIGNSDACGFGIDGSVSSTWNFLSMDPSHGNVLFAWGSQVAERLGFGKLAVRTIAGSGKGIVRNAPFCGDQTLPSLWRDCCMKIDEVPLPEAPRAVLMLAGGNDFFHQEPPDEMGFVTEFKNFLLDIHAHHGHSVPVFLFQCGAGCSSSAGSPFLHPADDAASVKSVNKLIDLTRVAASAASAEAGRELYFIPLTTTLDLNEDFAVMMHWSRSGHKKIATEISAFVLPHLSSSRGLV